MPSELLESPLAAERLQSARPVRPLATDEPVATDDPGIAVVLENAAMREAVRTELAQQDVRTQFWTCAPDDRHIVKARVVVTDEPGFGRLPSRIDGRLLVLCDRPDPRTRIRLLARGVWRVLDVNGPEQQLAEVIRDVAQSGPDERETPHLTEFLSSNTSMLELVETARLLVDVESPVLITGETGVGKEHLARAVHGEGERAANPFLVVNCGALPESLLESQLFGHVRGAFTGADRPHAGFFETAGNGTLLLDEIGEMPPHLQVKLLTALERREVVPVGGSKPIRVKARIMAATNRNLDQEVEQGGFRADLFYRLNVVRLDLPPLRERRDEIPDLVGRALFDLRNTGTRRSRVRDVDEAALQALLSYDWPGNIRELRNMIERAIVLRQGSRLGKIDVDSLPAELRGGRSVDQTPPASQPSAADHLAAGRRLREVREAAVAAAERDYLEAALRATGGRINRTVELVGLGTRSLYDKMQRYGLRKEDYRNS